MPERKIAGRAVCVACAWAVLAATLLAGEPGQPAAGPRQKANRKTRSIQQQGLPESDAGVLHGGYWLDPVKDEPAATLYKTFFSETVQKDVSYLVYLPPDYETETERRWPVVYWLHGGGGNQRTGDNFVERLDAAIRSGAAPAMIAVLVNGVGGSLFCDSIDGNVPVESVIVKDLIPHVDAAYRTHGTRRMRAIEGFSMGGFGALHLGFKYPHLFGGVTALAHAPIRPDSGWPKVERVWQLGPFAGNVDYFAENDPFQLVEKNAEAIRVGTQTRLTVGDADNPNTVARTRELHEKMTGVDLPCQLIVVPGIKHSYMNLYAELGDGEFQFYRSLFSGQGTESDAPESARQQEAASMCGLYAGVKIPDTQEEADRLVAALRDNSFLTGVLLSVPWREIEPAEGQYDWSGLDRAVELIRKAGKQYKLKVTPGIYSPDYIYNAGAERFDTIIANVNRANYGDATTIPVPWDPGYQRHFSRLICTLGKRYASDPHCVAVTLTCANYQSAEMHLPPRPEDMETWKRFGLSAEKLLGVYQKYLDEWACAFPRQVVCLHVSKSTDLEGASKNEFAERIIRYGLEKYPRRFAIQSNGLNGRKEAPAASDDPLLCYSDRLLNGFQSFAGFASTPQRQGGVEMAVLNYVRGNAEYWELWQADGLSTETCRQIQAALDEATSLGYEAYRKKLIATGQYRRAEDDPWPRLREEMRRRKDAARVQTQGGGA